jgi:hypothetical protein
MRDTKNTARRKRRQSGARDARTCESIRVGRGLCPKSSFHARAILGRGRKARYGVSGAKLLRGPAETAYDRISASLTRRSWAAGFVTCITPHTHFFAHFEGSVTNPAEQENALLIQQLDVREMLTTRNRRNGRPTLAKRNSVDSVAVGSLGATHVMNRARSGKGGAITFAFRVPDRVFRLRCWAFRRRLT